MSDKRIGRALFAVGWRTEALVLGGELVPRDLIEAFHKEYGFAFTVSVN